MTNLKIGCNQMTITQFEIWQSKLKLIGGIVFQLWTCITRIEIYGQKSVSPEYGTDQKNWKFGPWPWPFGDESADPCVREIKLTEQKIPIYIISTHHPVSGWFSNWICCSIPDWLPGFERHIWKLSSAVVCKVQITAQVSIIIMIFELTNHTLR